jgi:hypothetical protein
MEPMVTNISNTCFFFLESFEVKILHLELEQGRKMALKLDFFTWSLNNEERFLLTDQQ